MQGISKTILSHRASTPPSLYLLPLEDSPRRQRTGEDFHSPVTLIFCVLDCYLQEETYNSRHTPETCDS